MPSPIVRFGKDNRLADNSITDNKGRLEVFVDGSWGTVCRKPQFLGMSALVACGQMCYPVGKPYLADVTPGWGRIAMAKVECNGKEDGVQNCPYSAPPSDCTHSADVGAQCFKREYCLV